MATPKRPRSSSKKTASSKAEPTSNAEITKATTHTGDLRETIRVRAYERFVQRGCTHGNDLDDWFRAESDVRNHLGAR